VSAAAFADQLDVLNEPVEVVSTPPQTLMVTVTAPAPGDATFAASPVAVTHVVVADVVGVAVGLFVAVAVGDAVAVREVGAEVGEVAP
jgi:hypothetical protein